MSKQIKRPLFDALLDYANSDVTAFDVPGHKMGKGLHPDLQQLSTKTLLKLDINSNPGLDILSNPEGVILEAEQLAAELFEADHAFFLVNGSTGGIQNMMLAVLKPGDKILLPRNIHKSAVNGLVLTGAVPIFIQPEIEPTLGFAVGHSYKRTKHLIDKHPDAKAILLLNPTYYGFTSDIRAITQYAHKKGLMVLVDESHGTHFTFNHDFGIPAMAAGADMATLSVHKTGGSFTQSSLLLLNERSLSAKRVQSAINVMQTSSASYLLMSSLDLARHHLAMNPQLMESVYELSHYATEAINRIPGVHAMGDYVSVHGEVFRHDVSKLLIDVHKLGLSGNEVFDLLKQDYNLQLEVGETNIVLAIVSIGDRKEDIDRLISALQDLSSLYYRTNQRNYVRRRFFHPELAMTPRDAFFSPTEYVSLDQADGRIAGDQIMIYPPGIPLLIPGERISKQIMIEYQRLIKQGNKVIGSVSNGAIKIKVIKED